jgi:hypothetical protein
MARKDLTALAALGTLGYMLSKKGDKKKDETKPNVYDVEDARKVEDTTEEDPMEAANRRVERTLVNPNAKEFGDPGTSETVTPTKKPVVRRPVVKSRPVSPAMDASMQEANASPMTRAEYDIGISNVPRRNSYYKKGGAVKKMASGGMASSASKRADGIATKGKTKCKMY